MHDLRLHIVSLAAIGLTGPLLAQVPLAGPLSDSTTGPLQAGVVYHVVNDCSVPQGSTLTVEPGAVVKLESLRQFNVNGTLNVQGTSATPVVFTDVRDDSAGGDTNGDGNATTPAPGGWRRIQFSATAQGTVRVAEVRYGGQQGSPITLFGGSSVTFEGVRVTDSAGDGWDFRNLSRLNTLIDCSAVACAGTAFTQVPIEAVARFTRPDAIANDRNMISVTSTTLVSDVSLDTTNLVADVLTLEPPSSVVSVPLGRALRLAPGVNVKFGQGIQLQVSGVLEAIGDVAAPVRFTDIRDDSVAGDTNGDLGQTSPAPGGWDGIVLANGSGPSTLEHVEVRHAGRSSRGSIDLWDAQATIVDSTVRLGVGAGVFMRESSRPTLLRVHVEDVDGYPIDGATLEAVPGFLDCTSTRTFFEAPNVPGGFAGSQVDEPVTITTRNGIGGILRVDNRVEVQGAGSLTVEPGMVFKCASSTPFLIRGPVEWNGTLANPIIFTSERDDTAGGDTNNDGSASVPSPGDWDAILFDGNATGTVRYVRLQYGGTGVFGFDAGIEIFEADVRIEDCLIADVDGDGLDLNGRDANSRVERCLFRDCLGTAVRQLNWNTLGRLLDNRAEGNGFDRMEVTSGQITGSVAITERSGIEGELYVRNAAPGGVLLPVGGSLVIGRGVVFKIAQGVHIVMDGTVTIGGTTEWDDRPVVFTDESDDSWGTDINKDGSANLPAPGHWSGIWLRASDSQAPSTFATVRNMLVRYAGRTTDYGVRVSDPIGGGGSQVFLSFCRVEHCRGAGFR
ncbi:MAG: hypothetical protein AAGG01_12195, partial [Planctomycetota bacterium]